MRKVGEKGVPPSFCSCRAGRSDYRASPRRGQAGGAAGREYSVTRPFKLCVYRHLGAQIHSSLLNLPNQTGSNWNVKTVFLILLFSLTPFLLKSSLDYKFYN